MQLNMIKHPIKKQRSFNRSRFIQGQGMTEYIVIVAIIAIGAVTAAGFFGARVQAQFVSMGEEIAGNAGAPDGAITAPTPAPAKLNTYGNN